MQTPSPQDVESWAQAIERGGIIGLLAVVSFSLGLVLYRQYQSVVRLYESRIADLEVERKMLLELALRGSTMAQESIQIAKKNSKER